jgi:hypothetical protein
MNTLTNMPDEIEPQEKESDKKIEEDKKLWPRDPLREENEKASAETERHLWPEGEAEEEEDKKLWPRDPLREEDEKASAEKERELWTEDEKKEEEKKKE